LLFSDQEKGGFPDGNRPVKIVVLYTHSLPQSHTANQLAITSRSRGGGARAGGLINTAGRLSMAEKLTQEQVDECKEDFDLFDADEDGKTPLIIRAH
jgi:hypothetical protein